VSVAAPSLGQADFLRLLTTQLKSQDPLSPMDNTAFVAQMAQFSQVSGIAEMNATLKSLTTQLGDDRLASATALVGKAVAADGDFARVQSLSRSAAGAITLHLDGGTTLPLAAVQKIRS
jgi:flagellar basal-body rod modification protein FlgD